MNLVDIIVIVIIIFGGIVGYKRRFISELVHFCGFIVMLLAAFLFKNPVAALLYEHLPFINLPGILSGVSVLNILIYEILAFFIVFVFLYLIFLLILKISHLIDNLFDENELFSTPSKLGGFAIGLVENYFVAFIVLYILTLPLFDLEMVRDSKLRTMILSKTPVLNLYVDSAVNVGKEFWDVAEQYKKVENHEHLNLEALDLLLKYEATTVESIDVLVEQNKIQINNIESVLMKYRKND